MCVSKAALRIAPDEKSALTNLARLHEELGNVEVAASYRQRIRQHEASNPYYHFGLAQSAYGNGNDVLALDEVRKAIALKRDDHRFYFLEGLIHYRQGDVVDARASIATAQRLSEAQVAADSYLQGVSEVLSEAHAAFAREVEGTLRKGNSEFHKQLSDAVGILRGAIQEIGDVVDSLPERA